MLLGSIARRRRAAVQINTLYIDGNGHLLLNTTAKDNAAQGGYIAVVTPPGV